MRISDWSSDVCSSDLVHKLEHIAGEFVGIGCQVAPQGACRYLVGTGRAAQAQVDSAGVQRFERAELLGNDQGRVIEQPDAAGTNADGGCSGCNGGNRQEERRVGKEGGGTCRSWGSPVN